MERLGRWTLGPRAYWAMDRATGMATYPDHGFGAWADYWCEKCEQPIFGDPEVAILARESWDRYGGTPEERAWICPHCGGLDVNEWTQHRKGLALVRRYYIHRNPYYREAV